MKRLTTAISLFIVTLVLTGLPGPSQGQDVGDCPNPPPPSQTSETITYTGAIRQVAIPEWVSTLDVTAEGGWGESRKGKTGPGGAAGSVSGTIDLTRTPDATCLDVWVGGYGTHDPAFGWGNGGGGGTNPGEGANGGGGGGATAVVPVGATEPLLVAGGGGGGGGNGTDWQNRSNGTPGAGGGDGIGEGSEGWQGGDGGQPDFGPQGPDSSRYEQQVGGLAETGDGPNGETGFNLANNEFGCPASIGAGGGGGGGKQGGGAGQEQDPMVVVDKEPACLNASYGFGAGGGAGGDSYASPDLQTASGSPSAGPCPNGSGAPSCYGSITFDWAVDIGAVNAIGGSGQTATIGSRLPGPLQARVTATNGQPIPGLDVTFTLPKTGPSASFIAGGSPAGTVTVPTDASGTATTPPVQAGPTAGSYKAVATVNGFGKSTSFSLANTPAPTATALWATPTNPSVTGEPVTFVAQVRAAPSTAPAPVGSVQFNLDGDPLGTPVTIGPSGEALSVPVPLDPGYHQVAANYLPSPNFQASKGQIRQEVSLANTHVELSSSENPSAGGAGLTFTTNVSSTAPATGTPAGMVTFTADDVPIGSPVELSGGEATSDGVSLPTGAHTIEAIYGGAPDFNPSDVTLRQSVGADATATELSAEPKVAVVGETVTVNAVVKPPAGVADAPTGAVDITVDGVTACDSVTLVDGEASCEITASPVPGSHSIAADYVPGSGDFEASDGTLTHLILRGRSTVEVEADPDPSFFGQGIGFHSQVDAIAPAAGTPTGTVRFTLDGGSVADPVPLRDGRADSETVTGLPAGPHAVVASYGGDASFIKNSSATTQVVDRAITLSTLTPSANRAPAGTPITFALDLTSNTPAAGRPAGSTRLFVNGEARGPLTKVESGRARLGPVTLDRGSHQIRASYYGSLNFTPIDALRTETAVRNRGPVKPDVIPGYFARGPLLCSRALALHGVRIKGSKLTITGSARTNYVGQRVAIRSRGRTVARTRVRAGGTLKVTLKRPRGAKFRTTSYVAKAGSARSNLLAAKQRLRIVSSRAKGPRQMRLRAKLTGGPVARIVLKRKVGCGARGVTTVHPVKIRPAKRRQGRRTMVVTVPRPAHSQGTVSYWLKASGKPLKSLPALVAAETR